MEERKKDGERTGNGSKDEKYELKCYTLNSLHDTSNITNSLPQIYPNIYIFREHLGKLHKENVNTRNE